MNMLAVQQLVHDAGLWEEAEQSHRDIIQQGLQKILNLLHPGAGRIPKDVQIDAVHALVFGRSDVLMVARTGEGKSLVFQAFAMLTGQITLQIVPLNRLGIEQSDDIGRMNQFQGDSGKPIICSVAVTGDEKERNPRLYQEIAEGKYQHIIMGPEQASHPGFRNLIGRPEVRNRIGLVAIDEVHLVSKWKEFRPEYVQLFELRQILRIDTVWLGASATVSKETGAFVLDRAGFRAVGDRPWYTKIVRSSIDRPDICYVMKKIPNGHLGSYDLLYFVVCGAATQMTTLEDVRKATERKIQDGEATPQKIQKTMIFVDGRRYVQDAVDTIRKWLVASTKDSTGRRYTWPGEGGVDVCTVVQSYTSTTAKHDQETRYSEFSRIGTASKIRIMVTTTALSTGVNIPDVAIVVQWKFPITKDLEDAVQRLGRVGRLPGLNGVAFLFLPYYIDDKTKRTRPGASTPGVEPILQSGSRRERLTTVPSSLRHVELPGEGAGGLSDQDPSDAGSEASDEEAELEPLSFWNASETRSREKIGNIWKQLWNDRYLNGGTGRCPRQIINEYLGENERQYAQDPAPRDRCCNHCNKELYPDLPLPPVQPKPITAPRAGSRPAIAQGYLKDWCIEQAEELFPKRNRMFKIPASFFMPDRILWRVCDAFKRAKTLEAFNAATEESVRDLIGGEFDGWTKNHRLPCLVECLNRIAPEVYAEARKMTEARSKKVAATRARRATATGPSDTASPSSTVEPLPQTLDTRCRRSQHAIRTAGMQEILRKRAVINSQAQARAYIQTQRPAQGVQTQAVSWTRRCHGPRQRPTEISRTVPCWCWCWVPWAHGPQGFARTVPCWCWGWYRGHHGHRRVTYTPRRAALLLAPSRFVLCIS